MALTAFYNTCPDDCNTGFEFPALDTDQNCASVPSLSQLTDLWISPNDSALSPFANWVNTGFTILANPTAIDNSTTDNSKVKWLTGIGGLDVPEKTVFTVHKRQKVTSKRLFTLTWQVFNLSNAQYEFLRSMQCNPTNFTFWYANDTHVWGKSTGIVPVSTDVDFPLGAGEGDVEQATLTIQFEAKVDPERKSNPYSDSDSVS